MKTPIKTEYRGIVFDSKSEAVFARTLDLLGHPWQYHPVDEHHIHQWDFLVYLKRGGNKFYPTLIEYKPCCPTETYIDNLTKSMFKKFGWNKEGESLLVWGNPWEGPTWDGLSYVSYPILSSYGEYGWGDFMYQADTGEVGKSCCHRFKEMFNCDSDEIIQEAKRYRFDLQHKNEKASDETIEEYYDEQPGLFCQWKNFLSKLNVQCEYRKLNGKTILYLVDIQCWIDVLPDESKSYDKLYDSINEMRNTLSDMEVNLECDDEDTPISPYTFGFIFIGSPRDMNGTFVGNDTKDSSSGGLSSSGTYSGISDVDIVLENGKIVFVIDDYADRSFYDNHWRMLDVVKNRLTKEDDIMYTFRNETI